MKLKQGYVNKETLEVTFMQSKCLPKEKLYGHLIPVPEFNYSYQERESLGNGWYGSKETVNTSCDNCYAVIVDGKLIGYTFITNNDRKVWLHTKSTNKSFNKALEKTINTLNI